MHIRFQCTVTMVFPKVLVITVMRSLADKMIALANNTGHLDLRTLPSFFIICFGTLHIWRTSKQLILNFSNCGLFL